METSLNNLSLDTAVEEMKWDLPLPDLFRLSLNFYKEKKTAVHHISYEDTLKLVAFTQQAVHGPLEKSSVPPLGVLDVIGRDRRTAWQNLGSITRSQSMEGFIDLLDRLCPAFRAYVEAVKEDRQAQQKKQQEEAQQRRELRDREQRQQDEQSRLEEAKNREELQRRELQNALNQQTFNQFKAYAEKQFPANPDQQAVLIRQLQTEHYHQYMQQLQSQFQQDTVTSGGDLSSAINNGVDQMQQPQQGQQQAVGGGGAGVPMAPPHSDGDEEDSDCSDSVTTSIVRANMWTRSDVKAFKAEVSAGKGDGVLRVGHGDTVTVRVPTHEGGSCLFWEFATDNHDIGFGVYFEWGKPATTEVSVHISESDDEDDEDPGEEGDEEIESYSDLATTDDLESGSIVRGAPGGYKHRPDTTIIVPIYRRDCHNEVYAGSHSYPGEGVYLLKFDNSYSLWRSKTLYYRVFYTR